MKNPFRIGLLTLAVLFVLYVAAFFLLPDPATLRRGGLDSDTDGDDPQWVEARAWSREAPGRFLLVCGWPTDLPRGGRLEAGPEGAPGFWDDGQLVQGVGQAEGGAVLRSPDGAVRAWVGWSAAGCVVYRPRPVRVEGQAVRADGTPVVGVRVRGCGQDVTAGEEGRFQLVLDGEAFVDAVPASGGPRCPLDAGGPDTMIRLSEGGVRTVLVQVGT